MTQANLMLQCGFKWTQPVVAKRFPNNKVLIHHTECECTLRLNHAGSHKCKRGFTRERDEIGDSDPPGS